MKNFKYIPLCIIGIILFSTSNLFAQLSSIEKGRAKAMLKEIVNKVEDKYYDPNLKGIDIKAKEKRTRNQ